jgi:hypothetical protein
VKKIKISIVRGTQKSSSFIMVLAFLLHVNNQFMMPLILRKNCTFAVKYIHKGQKWRSKGELERERVRDRDCVSEGGGFWESGQFGLGSRHKLSTRSCLQGEYKFIYFPFQNFKTSFLLQIKVLSLNIIFINYWMKKENIGTLSWIACM